MTTIEVNDTLTVQVGPGADPHVVVERAGGGAVRVEPAEIRHLVRALVEGACRLGDAAIEVQR